MYMILYDYNQNNKNLFIISTHQKSYYFKTKQKWFSFLARWATVLFFILGQQTLEMTRRLNFYLFVATIFFFQFIYLVRLVSNVSI